MAFPTPTVLAGTSPYFRGVTTRVLIIPSMATFGAPTSAEESAGTDYTAQIMAISGFELSQASLDLNLAGNGFTGSVGGRTSPGTCSIQFELSSTGPTGDVRSRLLPQSLQYVAFAHEGYATGLSHDLWAVRIGDYTVASDLEAIGSVTVPMFPYRHPATGIAIPTA